MRAAKGPPLPPDMFEVFVRARCFVRGTKAKRVLEASSLRHGPPLGLTGDKMVDQVVRDIAASAVDYRWRFAFAPKRGEETKAVPPKNAIRFHDLKIGPMP